MHPQYTPYLFAIPFLASYLSHVNAVPTNFNLTAITASNNISMFQCWQLTDPIISGEQPGYGTEMILQNLGAMGNATYGYLRADFPGASHVAPTAQFVSSHIINSSLPSHPKNRIQLILTEQPDTCFFSPEKWSSPYPKQTRLQLSQQAQMALLWQRIRKT